MLFHGKRHPQEMGGAEAEAFLTLLAVARQVFSSPKNQAKAAILYFSKQVLGVDMPWLDDVVQESSKRLPVVPTIREVRDFLLIMQDAARKGCGGRFWPRAFAACAGREVPAAGPRYLSRLAPFSTHRISRLLEQHRQRTGDGLA